jgi:hypothetical protein
MRCFTIPTVRFLVLSLAFTLSACLATSEDELAVDPPRSAEDLQSLAESVSSEQSELAHPDAIVWCSDKSWRVDFYAEPELINVVGFLQCQCFRPQSRGGTVTNYMNLAYEFTCELD